MNTIRTVMTKHRVVTEGSGRRIVPEVVRPLAIRRSDAFPIIETYQSEMPKIVRWESFPASLTFQPPGARERDRRVMAAENRYAHS